MFKKIFLFLFVLALLSLAAAITFAYFYEDEVKSYAVQSLNKQLTTEVDVGNIKFSVLRSFPLASLEFEDVSAMETWQKTKKDTLFYAKSIFLKFNVWDIYNENYRVKELEIRHARLNMQVDEAGTENYHFWESEKNDSSNTGSFSFELEKLMVTDMDFRYENKLSSILMHLDLKENKLTGNIQESVFSAQIDSDFIVKELTKKQEPFFAAHEVSISGEVQVNAAQSLYTFKKTALTVEGVEVELDGFLDFSEETYVDIAFAGKNIDFKNTLALLNNDGKEYLSGYEIAGKAILDGKLTGFMDEKNSPHISLNFAVSKASLKKASSKVALDQIELKGVYTNGDKNKKSSSLLELQSFSAKLGKGQISGKLKLHNFDQPKYEIEGKLDLQFAEISHFLDFDDLEGLNGNLIAEVKSKGRLASLEKITVEDWKNANSVGNIQFSEVNFRVKDRPQEFKDISGKLLIVNNSLLAEHLQGKISNTDFMLKGKFINLIGFLLDEKQGLMVDAVLKSQNMELDELLLSNEKETEGEEDYLFTISERINLTLNAEIGHLDFKKFSFNKCRSNLSIKNQVFLAENIHFESMGGVVEGNLKVDARNNGFLLISSESSSKNLNIQQLFQDFNNFGQQVLTSSNIQGVASADINFRSKWSPQLQMDPKSMLLDGSFLIQEGRIMNFDPLKKLSKYISLEELNDIRFSTLQNNIQIKEETIFIPEFEIISSVMDLSLRGSHTFNNKIDYRIELIVDQLLGMKIKMPKKDTQTEFGYVEDDGLGRSKLFIKMSGNMDNPNIGYDSQQLKEHWKKEVKKEKTEVKEILNDEFGIFKGSSKESKKEAASEESPFQIEWGDQNIEKDKVETKDMQQKHDEKTNKKEKSGFNKFFDKIAEPNNDEYIQPKKE